MTELAAEPFWKVASNDAIANDSVVPYYLADRKLRISIARVDDRLYAFDDLCTCSDKRCPLSGGLLTGTTLMCQCHGSRFDITTGVVINGPATDSLTTYAVHEVDGDIEIRVDGRADTTSHDAQRVQARLALGLILIPVIFVVMCAALVRRRRATHPHLRR